MIYKTVENRIFIQGSLFNKIDFKLNLILNIQKPKSRESCIDLYEEKLLEKSVKGDYKIIYKDYSSVQDKA